VTASSRPGSALRTKVTLSDTNYTADRRLDPGAEHRRIVGDRVPSSAVGAPVSGPAAG
jgi:hypothetical protein